jgi:endogenous inhibitor of DNA gyrase (YacG/DUF329 family)
MAHKKALLQLGPCPECGKHFESRYEKTYCGMECYTSSAAFKSRMASYNDEKKNIVRGECPQCGVEFFAKASRKQKFCSKNHYRAYMAERFDRWIASPQAVALPQAYDEFLTLDELPCLIEGCDWHGLNLGQHLNFAHGIPANEFKKLAGFNKSTGLVTPAVSEALANRPHLAFAVPPITQTTGKTRESPSLEAREHAAKARALAMVSADSIKRLCKGCGKEFQQDIPFGVKKYCSIECRDVFYKKARPFETLICAECGKPFQTQSKEQQQRSKEGVPVFDTFSCRQKRNGRFRTLRGGREKLHAP